jgi:putative ABC transport system permease protein
MIGILFVIGLSILVSHLTSFQIFFSASIFTFGISIAIGIGIISGISPAILASRMDPVIALRK